MLLASARRGLTLGRRWSSDLVKIEASAPVASITLQRAPVNSLNTDLLKAIHGGVKVLEQADGVKAFVLTSAFDGRAFSAGLDLLEMHAPEGTESLESFWSTLQECWMALYTTPLAAVACLNGTAPAGGTLLATACDRRILADNPKFQLGLNEAAFGLVAPDFFLESFTNVVGFRNAEWLATTGKLVGPAEALEVGLVDEVVAPGDVLAKSLEAAEALAKLPFSARAETKRRMRRRTAANLEATKAEDVAVFVDLATRPEVQAMLGAYVASLKKKT